MSDTIKGLVTIAAAVAFSGSINPVNAQSPEFTPYPGENNSTDYGNGQQIGGDIVDGIIYPPEEICGFNPDNYIYI
ncbi:MAG: hypothetical protein Q9M91_01885 [Candidatus Dojkabacteria bacterium]|nr:hypothetical protein [Candidatus Dojkabacteria bacterium]MDQ7020574.1 hypothetical protein [Candidatus Dojkabacteria bacterium]